MPFIAKTAVVLGPINPCSSDAAVGNAEDFSVTRTTSWRPMSRACRWRESGQTCASRHNVSGRPYAQHGRTSVGFREPRYAEWSLPVVRDDRNDARAFGLQNEAELSRELHDQI